MCECVYVCRWQRVPEVPAFYGSLQEWGRGSMPGLVSMETEMWISWIFWVCMCLYGNIWIQYLYMRGFWISVVSAQMESPPFVDLLFCTAHKILSIHAKKKKKDTVCAGFNQSVFILIESYLVPRLQEWGFGIERYSRVSFFLCYLMLTKATFVYNKIYFHYIYLFSRVPTTINTLSFVYKLQDIFDLSLIQNPLELIT